MVHLLAVFLCLVPFVQGASIDMASFSCPPTDEPTRSVWSILSSCGTTLLVCVWHAMHPRIPHPERAWYKAVWERLRSVMLAFFAPEVVVGIASKEWWEARNKVKEFHRKGYKWSMTHSYFAEMGGFTYYDNQGHSSTIDASEFLELCETNKIANPDITAKEIKDKSKSDLVGKTILAVQLLWFAIQVLARVLKGFAVTLVELDTVSMAALTLSYLFLWRDKPLHVECTHDLYSPEQVKEDSELNWSTAWKEEPWCPRWVMAPFVCIRDNQAKPDEEKKPLVDMICMRSKSGKHTTSSLDSDAVKRLSLCSTWLVLGGIHLAAWKSDFPTKIERTMWHVASLVLAGTPLAVISVWFLSTTFKSMGLVKEAGRSKTVVGTFQWCALVVGIASRVLLVGLMLASLRALPCSAHLIVPWTYYIPHL